MVNRQTLPPVLSTDGVDHCCMKGKLWLWTIAPRKACVAWAGLTVKGVLHSWALGTAVYSAFGAGGYLLVCIYFVLGSAVSS